MRNGLVFVPGQPWHSDRIYSRSVNGAQALINTLVDGGVDVCFANPGTSEMHFVAALDSVPRMRGVLALFEGVATGAADGYARIAGRPAAVLLHLGPGLGNGLANLHNARRAHVPMLVVVGDHATYHKKYDAPLESDIDALAGTVSGWLRRTPDSADVGADAAEAISASRSGCAISTLILPADTSWTDGAEAAAVSPAQPAAADPLLAPEVREVLRSGEPTVIMMGGDATRRPGSGGGGADRPGHGGTSAVRDVPDATGARRRASPPSIGSPTSAEAAAGPARRRQASGAGRRQVAGVVLRLPWHAQRPGSRRLRGACARRIHRRRRRIDRAGRRAGTRHVPHPSQSRVAPAAADRRADRGVGGRRGRRADAREARSSSTSPTPPAFRCPRPPPARPRTTG